jgi:serine/threonine-protein kinase
MRGIPRLLSGGPTRFGPFWLDARLAVGGTAEIYVARPLDATGMPTKLIVKRLLPHFVNDPEGRLMFEREAALHAAVRSDHVVKVLGSGLEGDEPWLAVEFVDGCDLYRLLRRLAGDARRKLPQPLAVHVAREVLAALTAVHVAHDPNGQPLGIIHRDVTPSNVYLSASGQVKLGDFGIARSATRATMRSGGAAMLKGKFAYLAPEQIAGDPFDHRADLFSAAVVLTEMLLGQPLFSGSGQLAVLLAIRDCRIEPLREARGTMPPGLYEVLLKALARDPNARFPSAAALSSALAPFGPGETALGPARSELGALVRWVQSVPSSGAFRAAEPVRADHERPPEVPPVAAANSTLEPDSQRETGEYTAIPSYVLTQRGESRGPWSFARLVESLATGEVTRGDVVNYLGRGFAPIEAIEELARFLPPLTATTNRMANVGAPEFADDVSPAALVAVLLRVVESETSGVLFAEGPIESRRSIPPDSLPQPDTSLKELYFVRGRLHHVAASNASELLGQFLVRVGRITHEELDFALAILPRYDGRMGETLVSLGLVPSLDVFGAIRAQGGERLADLFQWQAGRVSFYEGQASPRVDFALDLDVVPLLASGYLGAPFDPASVEALRSHATTLLGPPPVPRPKLRDATWPPLARRILDAASAPRPLAEVLAAATGDAPELDALRAVELLLTAKLLAWS